MSTVGKKSVGGIDLNPELLDLQVKRDGRGIPLPVQEQPLLTLDIEGFIPVIIDIMLANLPALLGLRDKPEEAKLSTAARRVLKPKN